MGKEVFSLDFCGRNLTVETGEIAKQAGGSVVIRYEDTVVLSSTVASKTANILSDFFPLTVLYQEKLYSVGKRRSLLDYLKKTDVVSYRNIIDKLNLRK